MMPLPRVSAAIFLTLSVIGCSSVSYQDDPRHGSAVMDAIERQTRQATVDRFDPEWHQCNVGMGGVLRGQDGDSARAPLQRHQMELKRGRSSQDSPPLVNLK